MTERKQPPDHSIREQALDPACSFIVQAPAGSGKTDLLIKRYLTLLAIVERPEEILAITFTRKAAAEMRQRVLEALRRADEPAQSDNEVRLRELARTARDRDRERDWQLEQNPVRLRIQTIDSFNAELTRQLPLLAKLGAQPQIRETPTELYEEAARLTLDELESGENWSDTIAALLSHLDNDWHKAHTLLMDMLPRREQWLAPIQSISGREQAERALANEIEHQLEKLRPSVPDWATAEIIALAAFAADNVDPGSRIAECRDLNALPGTDAGALSQWRGIAELLLAGKGGWRRRMTKTEGMPAEAKGEKARITQLLHDLSETEDFRQRLHALRELPDPRYDERQWQLLQALAELLPLAVAQLKVVFAAHGQVDFPEVAERALQALGSADAPTDLGLRLDYRIRHILVDEYQDTSVIQHELLKLLTSGWQPDDGRSLFLVGDPMQSIYRFRAAEVGLFLETAEQGLVDIPLTSLQLGTNFRSQAGIVDWINQCFVQVLPQQSDIASGAVPYVPAKAWHENTGNPAVSVYPQFEKNEAAEAQQILDIIRQTTDAGTTTAVLVQTRNHLASLVPLLRQHGIRYKAMEIERLGRQPVVLDLLALTQALVHPADRIAWLSVLRAPWCGLTRHDLHVLAASCADATGPELINRETSDLDQRGRQRLERMREVLNATLENRRRQTLRDSVESAWFALGGPACVGTTAALDDAAAFLDLLERLEAGGDLENTAALVRELERLFAPPDPEAGDDLQIMTIHKAKGLEFDRVILPGLGRTGRNNDTQLLLWQVRQREHGADLLMAPVSAVGADSDPLYQFLKSLDKERAIYERGRLLYVACTRARQELHLLGQVNVKPKDDGSVEMSSPIAGSALSLLWPQLSASYEQALNTYQPTGNTDLAQQAAPTYTPSRLPDDWTLPALPEAVALPPAESSTAQTTRPIEFSWASETARVVGIVVHRLLQRIAQDGADAWTASRVDKLQTTVEAMLVQQGLPADRLSAATDQARKALRTMLEDDRGRWILNNKHEQAASEFSLSRFNNGRLESVIVDRTFVDKDGTRWIIDYKTGAHAGGDIEGFLDQEQERYQPQLERYAEFMQALEPRPVKLGLYFPLMAGWREWDSTQNSPE